MDFQIWINQSRELCERLEAAVAPGAVALAALDLARHRTGLATMDWSGQVLDGPVEALLALTEELPARIQLPIRVIAAAVWLQAGRTEDSRRVVDSMMGFEVWPMPSVISLFLPWAVLLADRPELLPLWRMRANHRGDEVVELLATHAPDEPLLRLLETAEAAQDLSFMAGLIQSMKKWRRLKALRKFSYFPILDRERETQPGCLSGAWIKQQIQQAVGELLVIRATETHRREEMHSVSIPASAESQEREAVIYYQEHFPVWRESLCHSARMARNVSLLRLVLQTPPDESCSVDAWWHAASALTEETRLEEVWPFICGADARIWKEISIHAEDMVERAVQTGELALAAELVNRIPSREAQSLRVRLERATAKVGTATEGGPTAGFLEASIQAVREGRLEEAASQAQAGIAAAKGIRNNDVRREVLFRLAACLICTSAVKEAFKIVLRYTKNAVDSDDAVKRYFEFIECCEGLDALEPLVRGCAAAGERWYELYSPNSLMNLAVAHFFYKEGFQPAVDLCRSLPEAAADEGLDIIHKCEGWDKKVSDIVQLMREWGNGKIAPHHCMNQVRRVEQKGNWEKAAELARLLIVEMDAQEGAKAAAAADLLKDFLDAAPVGGTSGSWPSVRSGVKEITRIFPMPPWREIGGNEFRELTEGLSGNRGEFDQFQAFNWKRMSMPHVMDAILESRALRITQMTASLKEVKTARSQWSGPPTPAVYFKVNEPRYDNGLICAVKAAWASGGLLAAQPWVDSILRISEASLDSQPPLSAGPRTALAFLDKLACFQFAAGPLPGFAASAEKILGRLTLSYDESFRSSCARIRTAMGDWDSLADLLLPKADNGDFPEDLLHQIGFLLPDAFLMAHRQEFARNTGMAHVMLGILAARGTTWEGQSLREAALARN